jgi:hypothetical protein
MAETRERPTEQEVGCYVYGVVPADATVEGLVGIDDEAVHYVAGDGVAVAVSPIVLERTTGRRAELLAHNRVIEALATAGAVVPVQFGSVMADEEAVREDLLGDAPRFAAVLERLDGLVQLNLRATYVEEQVLAEVVEADPVVADLRERTRDLPSDAPHPDLVRLGERIAQTLADFGERDRDIVLRQVAPLAVARRERASGPYDPLDVALLVERDRVGEVEAELEATAEALHPRVRLRLVGPVAPYDFVEDGWA